ncbi:hypothetical protein A2935_04100 [Candidatus Wolfebacteria bacterium RIFCSPLOWO2_01_FULL_47_17b]|uniref:AMP-dependent synthetase/ligase domain-containing protein n=1 Tax=Candidatus Wolfebacteria bacterium RIFCSPLOWO2_01_FULL_47_17b TaxID=1802558 RepID=A0A1F8DZ94_9BACT|nr:MAG: hypothetical protein A2935_04100 [Candidatus Wolfebacteria bacterium RIFCSPLOWO2_01_FULL_47_17b]
MRAFSDTFFSFIYQTLLDNWGRFIPHCFLQNDVITKSGLEFRLYIRIVNAYVYTLKRIEERGQSFAIKLQERRLRKMLAVAKKSKWWASYFERNNIDVGKIKKISDLKNIPPVNKHALLDVPKEDVSTRTVENASIVWRGTGGSTTGIPFVWGMNKTTSIINILAHFIKELECDDFSLGENGLRNFHMTFNFPRSAVLGPFKWFSNGDLFLNADEKNMASRIREISEIVTNLNKAVIQCSPSELKFLVDTLKEYDLHPAISLCLFTGQFLEESIRLLVKQYLKCGIVVCYGAQEIGFLALECKKYHGFYHTFSERVVVEIVDDKGGRIPHGTEGNVTITCLDNTVMPLIRYQPGDIGTLHYDMACECENKSPLLEIKGRKTDVIKFSSGENKSASRILKGFSKEPFLSNVRRFQVRQDNLDEIGVLLEVREHIAKKFIAALEKRLSLSYGGALKIQIKQVSTIPKDGPKFKVFVPLKD